MNQVAATSHWKAGVTGLVTLVAVMGLVVSAGAQAATKPKPKWDTSAAAGLTLTKGNSDTVVGTASIVTKGGYEGYSITLGADASFGENNGVRNNESYKVYGQYNKDISGKFYVFGRVEYLHDAIADIEYRVKLSPGFGWHAVKTERLTLDLELGPGYVFEKKGIVDDSYLTLRVGENLTYKINDRSRLWQSAEFLPQVEDFNNYILSFTVGAEADITTRLSLRIVLQDDYTSRPAAGRKANDLKLISGVAYKF